MGSGRWVDGGGERPLAQTAGQPQGSGEERGYGEAARGIREKKMDRDERDISGIEERETRN